MLSTDLKMQGLVDFGRHTRHIDSEAGELPRKLLAVSFAPHAYSHVAQDYDRVRLRTHSPPLEAYHTSRLPEAETFVPIMRDLWSAKVPLVDPATPKLAAFSEALFYHTAPQNDWRARAAFFIAHRIEHPEARQLLNAVLRDGKGDSGMQRVVEQDLWARMHAYLKENPLATTTAEWGAIFNGMTDAPAVAPVAKVPEPVVAAPVAEAFPAFVSARDQRPVARIAETPFAPTKTHEEWAQHPDVQEWRRAALMSPAADPRAITHAFARVALLADAPQRMRETASDLLADYASPEQARLLAEKLPHLGAEREYEPAEVVREAVKCGVYF